MWEMLNPNYTKRDLGFLPQIIDPTVIMEPGITVVDLINSGYAHGGGFHRMINWTYDAASSAIKFPGDPALKPIAKCHIGTETVFVYEGAWVCIVQSDGKFAVTRMD